MLDNPSGDPEDDGLKHLNAFLQRLEQDQHAGGGTAGQAIHCFGVPCLMKR